MTPETQHALETLRRLKLQVDCAIRYIESGGHMVDCSQQDIDRLGGFDFQVGDFRVVDMAAFYLRNPPLKRIFP